MHFSNDSLTAKQIETKPIEKIAVVYAVYEQTKNTRMSTSVSKCYSYFVNLYPMSRLVALLFIAQ